MRRCAVYVEHCSQRANSCNRGMGECSLTDSMSLQEDAYGS